MPPGGAPALCPGIMVIGRSTGALSRSLLSATPYLLFIRGPDL